MLAPVVERAIGDDRSAIEEGDRILLIAEDDPTFAQILLDLARDRGFKGLVAQRADRALALAREYQPTAVTLDLRLPDADGWTILDRLKHDPATRHIPVHIISVDENWQRGLRLGAIDFLTKPATKESLSEALTALHEFVDRPVKRLLVVEDDETAQRSIVELIGDGDVQTTTVGTGEEALEALQTGRFDCMVLDLGLPDMTGFQLITRVKSEIGLRKLPTIVYTGKQLTKREEAELRPPGRVGGHQGRALARAAARRDGAVPAPGHGQPAREQAADARAAAPDRSRRSPAGPCSSSTTTSATSSR